MPGYEMRAMQKNCDAGGSSRTRRETAVALRTSSGASYTPPTSYAANLTMDGSTTTKPWSPAANTPRARAHFLLLPPARSECDAQQTGPGAIS